MLIHLLEGLGLAVVLIAVIMRLSAPAWQVREREAVREMERVEREFSGVRNDR